MNSDLVLKVPERASGCWPLERMGDQAIAFHNFGRGPSKGEHLGGSETVKSADVVSTYQAAVQGHQ